MTPNLARFLVGRWVCLGYFAVVCAGGLWAREPDNATLHLAYIEKRLFQLQELCAQRNHKPVLAPGKQETGNRVGNTGGGGLKQLGGHRGL